VALCNTCVVALLDLKQGLSIVIPAYNEGEELWISVECALKAFETLAIPFEILVIEDGSENLHKPLHLEENVRHIVKEHSGRIETIFHGISLTEHDNVLVIGARVRLREDSLHELALLIENYPSARFWNGMIYLLNTELPHVSIWETLVKVGWNRGLSGDGVKSYGLADFDLYPKGSGLFMAKRDDWLSGFNKIRDYARSSKVVVSDDTRLLRGFAELSNIWFSKDFAADYKPRTNFKSFLKNGFHRGTTFVDSYWDSDTIFGKLVRGLPPLAVALVITAAILTGVKGIWFLIGSALAVSQLAFLLYSLKTWNNPLRALKETIVLAPLILFFGSGFVRAYVLGFQSRRNA